MSVSTILTNGGKREKELDTHMIVLDTIEIITINAQLGMSPNAKMT